MPSLIVANWKMFGHLADITPYTTALRAAPKTADLVLCPPFHLLTTFATALSGSGIALGAQTCHPVPQGAHTGDISAPMLADAGVTYVIIGHSERRQAHGETNADVAAAATAAQAANLTPIICVGETAAQREAGEAADLVRLQLHHSLPPNFTGVIAYEPIWAIGTGLTPTESDITAMHATIREAAGPLTILYGGSVKPANAAAILALPNVGGALVGGASLVAADFLAIAAAAPAL
jgi:triosephosphate isomerase